MAELISSAYRNPLLLAHLEMGDALATRADADRSSMPYEERIARGQAIAAAVVELAGMEPLGEPDQYHQNVVRFVIRGGGAPPRARGWRYEVAGNGEHIAYENDDSVLEDASTIGYELLVGHTEVEVNVPFLTHPEFFPFHPTAELLVDSGVRTLDVMLQQMVAFSKFAQTIV